MLTFEPIVAMIATIVLPCAAIIFGMVALVTVVRRRFRRAMFLVVISSVCVVGTFVAATIVAHGDGLVPPRLNRPRVMRVPRGRVARRSG